MGSTRGIAARAGRWSAEHRFKAIAGWLAFVIAATAIGGAIGTQDSATSSMGVGESKRADAAIDAAFPDGSSELVLVASDGLTADRPRFRRAVAEATAALRATDGVARARSPYAPGAEGRAISATMKLLGDWNWYLPRSLAWLPTPGGRRRRPEPAEA